MESFNQTTIKQQMQQKHLMMKQHKRNEQRKRKQQRQPLSIIIVITMLCQAPAGNHALVQSRGSLHSFGVVASGSSTKDHVHSYSSTIYMKDKSTPSSSTTTLHYRNYKVTDGGYNQHKQHKKQRSNSSSPRIKSNSNSSSERQQLQQQLQQQQQHGDHQISNFFHTWWTSGKTRRAKELHAMQMKEEQRLKQCVLDDYLESIDRRYKRLNEEKHTRARNHQHNSSSISSSQGNKGGFTSALQWLTQTQSDSTSSRTEEMRKQEDAIYVLGLADLASARLLQRHQLPIPQSKRKSVVIDIDFEEPIQSMSGSHSRSGTNEDDPKTVTTLNSVNTDTISKDGTVALSKAILILHTLRQLRFTSIKKLMDQSSQKANLIALTILKSLGKKFTHGLGSVLSFIGSTSGLRSSLQVLSILAVSIVTFTMSLIRPLTKA